MKAIKWLPRLGAVILAGSWLTFILVGFSNVGITFPVFITGFYGAVLWFLVWLIRVIVFFILRRRRAPDAPASGRSKYLLFEPVVLVLTLVFVLSGLPEIARFELSRPALRQYVADVARNDSGERKQSAVAKRVGLYNISETELLRGRIVRLITAEDGFDHAGFVYIPSSSSRSKPPRIGEDSYQHISGPWWYWYRSW